MRLAKRLAASTALAVTLVFGTAGINAAGAAPTAATAASAPQVSEARSADPVAGRFCKNSEGGKVVGNLICKHDPSVNRNRWVVK